MSALNTLSTNQKTQLRHAFTLIDGDSRDSTITKQDLVNLYAQLGLAAPSVAQLDEMLAVGDGGDGKGINFAQFSNIMAKEFAQFDNRMTIYNALKVFSNQEEVPKFREGTVINIDELKEACCSVQLGEIGSGDHRLDRKVFDKLVDGFVQEESDGKRLFMVDKWLDAYID
ncbi:hypothetical protein DICA1_F02212 [Diutina catenulata]